MRCWTVENRKRVLITGGSGFVGANLARHLTNQGHEVHVTVRRPPSMWRLQDIRRDTPHTAYVTMWPCELTWDWDIANVVRTTRPEWVFHLATHGAYPTQQNSQQITKVNTEGFRNVLRAALDSKVEAFVNAGSSSEYGPKDHAPTEDEDCDPQGYYARTKLWATRHLRDVARHSSLPARTLRLYSVYGPWEEPTRLIPTVIAHGLQGTLPPFADPDTARDFVYVDDVCRAFEQAAKTIDSEIDPGAVYNIGTNRQTTLREVARQAQYLFGVHPQTPVFNAYPDRPHDTAIWRSNAAKAARFWIPVVPFYAGLKQTAIWLQVNRKVHARYREEIGLGGEIS